MEELKGDLLVYAQKKEFDVIIHGCNCFHSMGAGIAAQIAQRFPAALKADLKTEYGDEKKLGTYSFVKTPNFVIVNAYTQFNPGKDLNYDALKRVFRKIKKDFKGKRIGYPKIGAGIAGGDWNRISKIIDQELSGEDHKVVIL